MRAEDFLRAMPRPADDVYGPALSVPTPVEGRAGMLFKRDDLFRPFPEMPLNGGKVRQAMNLVRNNLDAIRAKHGGMVATCSSVHSPQGILVARIAKEFGLSCALGIGNNRGVDEVCKRHYNIAVARSLGCDVRVLSPMGYGTVLAARMKETFPRAFQIAFGMNFKHDRESILECVADQVQNLPRDLDALVVPMGSGLTAAGVLRGLAKHSIAVGKVHLVQISGFDRTGALRAALGSYGYDVGYREPGLPRSGLTVTLGRHSIPQINAEILVHVSHEYSYDKWVRVKIDDDMSLDGRYEAKAYKYMVGRIKPEGKVLFWVVGNSSCYFDPEVYGQARI
jgi:cysteine synthase